MYVDRFYTQQYYNALLSDRAKIEASGEPEVCREYNTDSKQDILDMIEDEIRVCQKKQMRVKYDYIFRNHE
jgi:hypothetical protein